MATATPAQVLDGTTLLQDSGLGAGEWDWGMGGGEVEVGTLEVEER